MTAKRRKKLSRQRGSHTHGWGSKKKHRGAGNRGGRGMAGTGKRGDAKKPSVWAERYFGKHGFKKKNIKVKISPINIRTIGQLLAGWINLKLAEENEGFIFIDLQKLGYNKLLSNGNASKKFKINVPYASAEAVEKVRAAGGEVAGLVEKAEQKPEQPKEEVKEE